MADESKIEETEEQEFDDAFNEAVGGTPKQQSDETISASLNENKNAGGFDVESDTPEETPVQEEPQAQDAGDQDFKALYEQAQAELNKERQRTSTWEGRIKAANDRAILAEQKVQEFLRKQQSDVAPAVEAELGDTDEDKALKEFITEFPDLQGGVKALAKKIAKQIVATELDRVKPDIESIKQTTQTNARETHFRMLEKAHSDFRELRDSGNITNWIASKPTILKNEYTRIYQGGTTQEIIEMLDICKKEINVSTKGDDNPKPSPSDAARKFTAVRSHSSGPREPKHINKDDFDSAWDEAVAQ